MKKLLSVLLIIGIVFSFDVYAYAQTGDEMTPAVEDVCLDPTNGTMRAIQEGNIIDGTGEFEDAEGSLVGRFQGTFRVIDTEDGKLQSFSNVNGISELTISY